ncbi:colicin V production protein [Frateuria sp. Soil773]|uniref:CvpA family protein n=1 Tax=Frateuria sp. Soil773 TaxID=1736407 RepID=UPI0006FFC4BB|nr:CvpA family protein [Frateuria sp. Soil773]KRE89304.1 colicin V production protein [Frateuria sp. Soil773]
MNWTDYIIIGVLGLSVLIGLWRGLISEVLALAVWVAAFWVAWTFGPAVAGYFEHSITLPSARIIVGYGLCFLVVVIGGALLRFVVGKLVEGTGLSGTDRLLGMLFGFARGVLLVTLMVFLLGFTAFTRDPWWQESKLLPQFKGVAAWLGEHVPDSVRRYLRTPEALERLPTLPGAAPAPAHSTFAAPAPATTAATTF